MVLVFLGIIARTVVGATYYVDSAFGSDSYPGTTISQAWKTLAQVNTFGSSVPGFTGGDTIYLNGTFYEQLTWNLATSHGTLGNHITVTSLYSSAPAQLVVKNMDGITFSSTGTTSAGLTIDNLVLIGDGPTSDSIGISITVGTGMGLLDSILLTQLQIFNFTGSAIATDPDLGAAWITNFQISGMYVVNCHSDGTRTAAVSLQGMKGGLVEQVNVYQSSTGTQYGIAVFWVDGLLFRDCTAANGLGGGILIDGATKNTRFERCTTQNNTYNGWEFSAYESAGVYYNISNVTLQDCVSDNDANGGGSGSTTNIYGGGYNSALINCTVSNMTLTRGGPCTLWDGSAYQTGFAFQGSVENFVIKDTSIKCPSPFGLRAVTSNQELVCNGTLCIVNYGAPTLKPSSSPTISPTTLTPTSVSHSPVTSSPTNVRPTAQPTKAPTPPGSAAMTGSGSKLTAGGAAGIVIGLIVLVAGVILCWWILRKKGIKLHDLTSKMKGEQDKGPQDPREVALDGVIKLCEQTLKGPKVTAQNKLFLQYVVAGAKEDKHSLIKPAATTTEPAERVEMMSLHTTQQEQGGKLFNMEDFEHSTFLSQGEGGSADLYKEKATGSQVVIKVPHHANELETEARVWRAIGLHPNVARMIGIVNLNDKPRGIVMEYYPGGSLDSAGHEFAPNELHHIAIDLARGLQCLHAHKVIHRDLAARNILVARDRRVVLTDFGLSRKLDENDTYKMVSDTKLPWRTLAPELILTENSGRVFTEKTDIWALGVTLWELATKKSAYADVAEKDAFKVVKEKIGSGVVKLDLTPIIMNHEKLAPALVGCFNRDPALRPTAEQLRWLLKDDSAAEVSDRANYVAAVQGAEYA